MLTSRFQSTAFALLRSSTVQAVIAALVWLAITFGFRAASAGLRWPMRVLWMVIPIWLLVMAIRALCRMRITWKKVLFTAIIVLVQYVALALVCQIFIVIMSRKDDRLTTRGMSALNVECRADIEGILDGRHINVIDPVLGWRLNPGAKSANYVINGQGFRASHDYPVTPPDPSKRVLCIGDSFTFGTAVSDDQTYPVHAEKALPGSEWLNFGVPGTCLTQSYLLYTTKARKFGGKYVVIGFMSNDAMRTVNCFRPFVNQDSASPLTKPFARLRDGELSLEPNPYQSAEDYRRLLSNDRDELEKLRRLDYLSWSRERPATNPILRTLSYISETQQLDKTFSSMFKGKVPFGASLTRLLPQDPYGKAIYSPRSEAFQAITALFTRYHDEVVADGRVPLILIMPGPLDVEDYRNDEPRQYASLVEYLRGKNYAVLDFLEPLVAKHRHELTTKALFVNSHYQGHINKELAAEVIKALGLAKPAKS